MASLFDWSSTASSNVACDGIGINTGMSPANVDNVFRSLMSLIRQSFASALQNFLAGTAALPVANGGTGATTAPNALTALGALSSDYRDLPRVDKTASFTISNSERGYGINFFSGSPATATINPYSTTPVNSGGVYLILNGGGTTLSVSRGSGVLLYKNGSTTSADATIAPSGIATLIAWSPDYWTINGVGVS